ncbi:MAG TPA: hypothetical protein VFH50_14125 [Acidimicrobiales bacterium]|nr:hypothetical protein [Acidimicrobiales bacterium]
MTQSELVPTRRALHRIAAHVLGRRRYQVAGRFGLRASPAGFATPAFGEGAEVIRVSGTRLVREGPDGVAFMPIPGSSLAGLARFAGTDLGGGFSVGTDTPDTGDPDETLRVDPAAAEAIAAWLDLGWRVLDGVIGTLGREAEPAVLQLWPEHFDAGTNVAVGADRRVNLGVSPGDDLCPEPYLYVGPWGPERPGDQGYWNVSFGALRRSSELGDDREGEAHRFITRGLEYLR